MLEFLGSLVGPVISGIVSAVSAVLLMMNRYQDKLEKLAGTVEHLKNERVNKLEITLNDHVKGDKEQTVSTKIDSLIGQVNKMDDKLDRIGEQVAAQGAQIVAAERYIKNLDESHQRCKAAHKV